LQPENQKIAMSHDYAELISKGILAIFNFQNKFLTASALDRSIRHHRAKLLGD